MRLNGLDLNLLVALNAVLSEHNISRAAARIHLSQPAMSNAMGRLRAYFNDPLLVRTGRRLVLTARAQTLVVPVREILMRIESTMGAAPAFEPASAQRQFSLQISDFTAIVLIPPLLARVAREAPSIRFRLLTQSVAEPTRLLEEGRADLLIVPEQYRASGHPSIRLFEESYVCVTWNGRRPRARTLSLDQYLAAGHVVAQFGDNRWPMAESWLLQRRGIVRREEVISPSLAAQADLVVGTDRIATMHERLARRALRYLPVRISPAPLPIPKLVEYAQWNRARGEDPGLQWLVSALAEVARQV